MRHSRLSRLAGIMQYAALLTAAVQQHGPKVIVIDADDPDWHKLILPPDPIPGRKKSGSLSPRIGGGQREKARRLRQMERAAAKREAKNAR